MRTISVVLTSLLAVVGLQAAHAEPLNLFTQLTYSGSDNSPPPPDSLAVYDSRLDVTGLAGMPTEVAVSIPRETGNVIATLQLERMDRREGFGERDPWACDQGDISACEIIPYPDLPADLFSYTWIGQGDGYDLRLTIHHGNAIGVLSGSAGRFAISWHTVKELRVGYFRSDEEFGNFGDPPRKSALAEDIPALSPAAAQGATLARIEPQLLGPAGATNTQLDLLFLITEEARLQAGGNPADCRDIAGVMTGVYTRINDMNTAFSRSQVPAQIGVVTVSRLNGYTLIPHNGNHNNTYANLISITGNTNIKAFRNAVGADVVSVLFDTQTNLGPCGVANTQRQGCTVPATPGCDVGPQFSEWSVYLDTIECTAMDVPTHELGHVLGAEHHFTPQGIPRNVASFPYSYGYSVYNSFETIMGQRSYGAPQHYPVRLLQFSNPNVNYGPGDGVPTGNAATEDNAHTLRNLLPGTAAFRSRPQRIFASGFDEQVACPGITF